MFGETLESRDRVAMDEWCSNRAKVSSKVGIAEPVRILVLNTVKLCAKFNKSKDHKDLIHV